MPLNPLNELKRFCAALQTLCIYGALGIASFGWTLSRLLHFDCKHYVALWFYAAVFIYNLDRLKSDPADPINMPLRSREAARFRKTSVVAASLSALAMVVAPVLQRDGIMIFLTICGGLICMNYSLSPFGFRFKDIPLLKTLFAPTVITAAFLLPPFLQQRGANTLAIWIIAAEWIWCVLMFNMVLCDLRDLRGDAATGIRSLPVALGLRRMLFGLAGLIVVTALLSIAAIHFSPQGTVAWRNVSATTLLYLAALFGVVCKSRKLSEAFYEWWVEGILFVPMIAYWFAR